MQWNLFKSNPEEGRFVRDRLEGHFTKRRSVVVLFVIVAILGWAYVFFRSGILDIKHINITGLQELTASEVSSAVYDIIDQEGSWFWKSRNTFWINKTRIADQLKERYFLEQVIVDNVFPNTLKVTITERQNQLVMSFHNNEMYLMDRDGFLNERLSPDAKKDILTSLDDANDPHVTPVLIIEHAGRVVPGEQYANESRTLAWLNAFQALKNAGFGYRYANLEHPTSTKLILDMYEPYQVYFDLLEPLEPQIASLYAFLKVRDQNVPVYNYIDARIPGKVFYK